MALHVHPTISSLKPYSPGKPLSELERELGICEAIKLASNENPWGPLSESVRSSWPRSDVASSVSRWWGRMSYGKL